MSIKAFAESMREDERKRIADHLKTIAEATLRDPTADAIDGYTAAVILELADTIRRNGMEP